MSETIRKTRPCALARGLAWALAALLALTLMMAAFGGIALWALNDEGLRERAANDSALIRKETEWAGQRIKELGAVYDFDPAPLMVILDRDLLAKQNLAGLNWMAATLNSMKPGESLDLDDGEIEEKLSLVLRFPNIKDPDQLQQTYGEAASKINNVIQNATFSIRNQITDKGLEKAREMADVRGFLDLIKKIPLILGICAAIAAGLIVLLIAADPKQALKYLGCAAGGTAVLMAVTVVMIKSVGMLGAVEAANSRLAMLISAVEAQLLLPLGLTAGGMLVIYVVFLLLYTRKGKTAAEAAGTSGTPETDEKPETEETAGPAENREPEEKAETEEKPEAPADRNT